MGVNCLGALSVLLRDVQNCLGALRVLNAQSNRFQSSQTGFKLGKPVSKSTFFTKNQRFLLKINVFYNELFTDSHFSVKV